MMTQSLRFIALFILILSSSLSLGQTTTIPGSPLSLILIGNQGGRHQAIYNGLRQVYPNSSTAGDSGVTIFFNGTSYGFQGNATGGIVGSNLFTVASQTGLLGNGTSSNPWSVETLLTAGSTLSIKQTAYYVNGDNYVSFRWDIKSTTNYSGVRFFHGVDTYNNAQDNGYGAFNTSCGSVSVGSPRTGTNFYQEYIPITPISAYRENTYSSIWTSIKSGSLNNTIVTSWHDAAMAHQWNFNLEANLTKTIFQKWSFAPSPCATPPNFPGYLPFDFGDAPDSYGTLHSSNGAAHSIRPTLYMGAVGPDSENGTFSDSNASADDTNGIDDEDLVSTFPALIQGANSYTLNNLSVFNNTGSPAYLVGWIDFDRSGSFDSDEAATVMVGSSASSQTVSLNWSSLPGLNPGTSYARFRLTSDTSIATGTASSSLAKGIAADGEVEDYRLTISPGTNLSVLKTVDTSELAIINDADNSKNVSPGDTILFSIEVSNLGPLNASSLSITDILNPGYSYVNGSISGADFHNDLDPGGTGLQWTLSSLNVGASASLSFQAVVQETIVSGSYQNTATVSSSLLDPDTSNNSSSVTPDILRIVKYVCNESLQLDSSCDVGSPNASDPNDDFEFSVNGSPGETLVYRIEYQNFATEVLNFNFTDDVPVFTDLLENSFAPTAEVWVQCHANGANTDALLDLGLVTAINANITDSSVCDGSILPGQSGAVIFKARIK